jgi:hypothetical protein
MGGKRGRAGGEGGGVQLAAECKRD